MRWIVVLGLLCLSAEPKRDTALERTKPAFMQACTDYCGKKHAPSAVSAQMIRAGCEDTCTKEWALPVLKSKAELKAQEGKRVRLSGTTAPGAPAEILLQDGTRVKLELETAHATNPRAGEHVIVAGTLRAGVLAEISAVAAIANE